MRTLLRSLVPIALVLAVAGCSSSKDKNEKRVVILFTTDEHSNLYASAPELDDFVHPSTATLRGGVERRMTILKQQRDAATAAGKATLTLSSGDFSQGSLATAAWLATSPELATMKLMGYDAVSLGNHEFDLGDAALAQAISKAVSLTDGAPQRPQLVLSNLDTSKATALAPLYGAGKPIARSLVLPTSNGLRIGVVASMGVGAGTVAGAAPAGAFWPATLTDTTSKFGAVLAQVQAAVDEVRAQGVDAVVLLAHGGIGESTAGEDELLAQQLKGVDLVLSGHSHSFTPQPRIVYGSKAVPVVQPKPFGQNVGKLELVFWDDGSVRPFLDPNATQFFEVTPDVAKWPSDSPLVTDLHARTIGFLENGVDQSRTDTTNPSFLEWTLTRIVGAPITTATPGLETPGSLWNFPLGTGLPNGCKLTSFDVTESAAGESNAMNLDADAIRDAGGTEIAVQAFGPVRGGLFRGATSEIAFSDVYHMAPLGADPVVAASPPAPTDPIAVQQEFLNGVPGYPLVRFNVPTVMLRIVYEATLQIALGQNGDFFLGASGLKVHYDPTRSPFNTAAVDPNNLATLVAPGWVTFMQLGDGRILYDTGNAAWAAGGYFNPSIAPTSFRTITTTYYVASFAASFGIPLYNDTGKQYGLPDSNANSAGPLTNAIVVRDGSHVKDYEAIGRFVRQLCEANTGTLPAEYGAAVPRRVCMGTCP